LKRERKLKASNLQSEEFRKIVRETVIESLHEMLSSKGQEGGLSVTGKDATGLHGSGARDVKTRFGYDEAEGLLGWFGVTKPMQDLWGNLFGEEGFVNLGGLFGSEGSPLGKAPQNLVDSFLDIFTTTFTPGTDKGGYWQGKFENWFPRLAGSLAPSAGGRASFGSSYGTLNIPGSGAIGMDPIEFKAGSRIKESIEKSNIASLADLDLQEFLNNVKNIKGSNTIVDLADNFAKLVGANPKTEYLKAAVEELQGHIPVPEKYIIDYAYKNFLSPFFKSALTKLQDMVEIIEDPSDKTLIVSKIEDTISQI
jgi:hypothetical protein